MKILNGRYGVAKVFTDNVEQEALNQIETLLEQDTFEDCNIRIMPDTHAGKGCVIGFTSEIKDKVIPNLVGVDIGCGMLVVKISDKNIDFEKLDNVIKEFVPHGKEVNEQRLIRFRELEDLKCFRELKDTKRIERSVGSLGGGNHFIEVGQDSNGFNYLVIHTGSRNLGKQVAEYYQNLAFDLNRGKGDLIIKRNEIIAFYKQSGRKAEIQQALRDLEKDFSLQGSNLPKELCFLFGEYKEAYLHDMKISQKFASLNRDMISKIIIDRMGFVEVERFETVHNYIADGVIRKGAVSAKLGEKIIVPINMRDGSLIAVGKGNKDWNCSAPHGAGRLMSRTKAKENISMQDFKESMKDVFTTSVTNDTLDEAPMAYKSMQEIIKNTKDTMEILEILRPLYNFKSHE